MTFIAIGDAVTLDILHLVRVQAKSYQKSHLWRGMMYGVLSQYKTFPSFYSLLQQNLLTKFLSNRESRIN